MFSRLLFNQLPLKRFHTEKAKHGLSYTIGFKGERKGPRGADGAISGIGALDGGILEGGDGEPGEGLAIKLGLPRYGFTDEVGVLVDIPRVVPVRGAGCINRKESVLAPSWVLPYDSQGT